MHGKPRESNIGARTPFEERSPRLPTSTKRPKSHMDELEARAIEIIKSRGDNGIYQHELWKTLGLDSRDGSRLALRLVKKGIVTREPAVYKGRRTYKLYIVKATKKPVKLSISIGATAEVPCFTCTYSDKCYIGGFHDPRTCQIMSTWLENLVERLKTQKITTAY